MFRDDLQHLRISRGLVRPGLGLICFYVSQLTRDGALHFAAKTTKIEFVSLRMQQQSWFNFMILTLEITNDAGSLLTVNKSKDKDCTAARSLFPRISDTLLSQSCNKL